MSVRSSANARTPSSLAAVATRPNTALLLTAALLTAALACAATAVLGAINGSAMAGWCLGAPQGAWLSMLGHCPWCYAALTLTAAAAAVPGLVSKTPIK